MSNVMEKWQTRSIELESQVKKNYDNKKFARQLIAGAKEHVDYSYGTNRNEVEWWVTYCKELEARV
jgi:hypothetical protein